MARCILRSPNVWLRSLMYFCYGWVLWMYLSWFPTYLIEVRGYTEIKMGLGASIPLFAATLTNVFGGWISDQLTRFWETSERALVVLITGFAIAAAALIPGVLSTSPAGSMFFLTLALAGLELTVPISWAISLDIGGDFSGSVSAVMNTLGNIGGTLGSLSMAYLITHFGWNVPFLTASGFCIAAALSEPASTRHFPLLPNTEQHQPRPTRGIFVAITVMNKTFASSGRFAMYRTASATCRTSIRGSTFSPVRLHHTVSRSSPSSLLQRCRYRFDCRQCRTYARRARSTWSLR